MVDSDGLMTLTLRVPSVIRVSWFNDLYNLLTGVMTDQPVSISNNLTLKGIAAGPGSAPTGTVVAGTVLGIGVYKYAYTYTTQAGGESLPSPLLSKTTTTGNQAVNLATIAVGPTGTYYRNIYRTLVGGTQLKLLNTISDNTTTIYTDAVADVSLGVNAPTHSSFGGALLVQDSSHVAHAKLYQDGAVSFDGGLITSDGAGGLAFPSTTTPKIISYLAMGTATGNAPTGVVVTHNLGVVPTAVFLCMHGSPPTVPQTSVDSSSLTTTQMTIYANANTIYWIAIA
jgi:hypothetical protein